MPLITWKKQGNLIIFLSFFLCLQFQTAAGSRSDANANRGGTDGKTSGQSQQRAAPVVPIYMTQDRLTLAVLTLLLGGWLAIALSFPIVSDSFLCLLLLVAELHVSVGQMSRGYF